MRITIANRLQPYSHAPGVSALLPRTEVLLQVFPCMIRFFALGSQKRSLKEIPLPFRGPLNDFTVLNDFEKGEIRVWGQSATGFVRYRCFMGSSGFVRLEFDKLPSEGVHIDGKTINVGEGIDLFSTVPPSSLPLERLSFGDHQAQDIEGIGRRLSLEEFWPFLYHLGQHIPPHLTEGAIPLLERCRQETRPEYLKGHWINLFQAHFTDLFVPRVVDDQLQGFPSALKECSPLALLSEAKDLIRRSFIQESEREISILCFLPPELHCGRLVNAKITGGTIDLEWTKKAIRRLIIHPSQEARTLLFRFKECQKFRLRHSTSDKGEWIISGTPLNLEKNIHYFLDNFQ